jgi:hypothetical protein
MSGRSAALPSPQQLQASNCLRVNCNQTKPFALHRHARDHHILFLAFRAHPIVPYFPFAKATAALAATAHKTHSSKWVSESECADAG